jgi:hypothetical protein
MTSGSGRQRERCERSGKVKKLRLPTRSSARSPLGPQKVSS